MNCKLYRTVSGGGGGGGDRVPSCRHRAGGVGQLLAGMQFSTKVLKCVVSFAEIFGNQLVPGY